MPRDPGGARWCEEHGRFECTKNRKRGGLCHGSRITGIDKCRMHAGQSGELAKWRGAAAVATATLGLPREVDPGQALLEEVHRTAGHVAWLGVQVAGLERGDVVWGVVEETDRPFTYGEDGSQTGGGTETKRKAVPNAWVVLYQQERRHLAAVSKAAIDAGVSERVVNVFEQVASSYVQVLERVLERLELTPEQRVRVPDVVTGELRAIAGGVV